MSQLELLLLLLRAIAISNIRDCWLIKFPMTSCMALEPLNWTISFLELRQLCEESIVCKFLKKFGERIVQGNIRSIERAHEEVTAE